MNNLSINVDTYKKDDGGTEDVIDNPRMGSDVANENSRKRKGSRQTEDEVDNKNKQRKNNIESESSARVWADGERFLGIDAVTGEFVSGKILSKVKGQHEALYNIESDQNGYQGWFNLNEVKDLSPVQKETEMFVFFNNHQVIQAKEKEMKNWIQNDVFEAVENKGQRYISVRWVVTEKVKEGKTITKARLVARGYEENTEHLRKDSPTCSKEAVRILLTIASTMQWTCHTLDITSAYLQGNEIKRSIFLKPPKEYDEGKLWKLKKTVYGLCDAARAWYFRLKEELQVLSVEMCKLDPSLFVWKRRGKTQGVICIHVDDFLYTGTADFYKWIISKLRSKFLVGSSDSVTFIYVGLRIKSYKDGLTVDQNQYIDGLEMIPISKTRAAEKSDCINDTEKHKYRALNGQLQWVATHTRPDIAFETCLLSSLFYNAKVADLLRLNKLVERVKRDNINLYFPRLENIKEVTLECYTDASLHNLPKNNSQGGILIFLRDNRGNKCPLLWRSKKLERVVKSTIAAETLALNEGAKYGIFLAHILNQLLEGIKVKIICYTDNKSIVDALLSTKKMNSPMLNIDTLILSEHLETGKIEAVKWVKGEQQLADPLTKLGVCTDKLKMVLSRD